MAATHYSNLRRIRTAVRWHPFDTSSGPSGATWGADGDNEVRPISDIYILDATTGLYHKQLAESNGVDDPIQYLDQTGYAFAAIPT